MKISAKLTIGFLIVIALMLCVAGTGFYALSTIENETNNLRTNVLNAERHARELNEASVRHGTLLYAFAYALEPDLVKYFAKNLIEFDKRVSEHRKAIDATQNNAEELAILKDMADKRAVYNSLVADLFKRNNVSPTGELMGPQPQFSELRDLLIQKVIPARDAYLASSHAFQVLEVKLAREGFEELAENSRFARMTAMVISAIATLIGMLIAWRLTAGITRPLNEAVHV
ncbi:MAG: MCP four helix bundle domain-containing protein, partial [Burkholderiaceae bacterium]|nr:MCP four helix bundle domain-containing protein [Burkholderiaceae bacterium]